MCIGPPSTLFLSLEFSGITTDDGQVRFVTLNVIEKYVCQTVAPLLKLDTKLRGRCTKNEKAKPQTLK